MEPIDIPARSILIRKEIRQVKFMPPPVKEGERIMKGMEDCGALDVLVEPADEEFELPRLHSWWSPNAEERRLIRQGHPIRVTIFGDGLAPMSLVVAD